jgi:hypothetical protein
MDNVQLSIIYGTMYKYPHADIYINLINKGLKNNFLELHFNGRHVNIPDYFFSFIFSFNTNHYKWPAQILLSTPYWPETEIA